MGYLLGIDLGTSSVRVTLVAPEGQIIALTQREYPILTPHLNWAEQEPDAWWKAACECILEALEGSNASADEVTAVGLSGQMHGLVMLGADQVPVRPAIIWPDKRSSKECDGIRHLIDTKELYSITGLPVATGFFGPSLMWVRENEPDVYERCQTAILPKDYIRLKLTGEVCTDATDASGTLLFDVRNRSWSNAVVSALGLKQELLPRVYESSEIVGSVGKDAALVTGLRPGTPVAAGGSDQAMGAVGSGAVEEGVVLATIGTGGQVIATTNDPIVDASQRIHTLCHVTEKSWILMGAILSAGLSLRWFRDNLGELENMAGRLAGVSSYEIMSREASTVEPGCDGLVFLPYLAGERTPHMDPKARGCFIGLTLSHKRAHMIRATMEGVTYAMKDSLSVFNELGIPTTRVMLSGGGAKSALWRQIQADVYGLPCATSSRDEHSSYGAALTAGVAAGVYKTFSEAAKMTASEGSVLTPIADNVCRYQSLYQVFRTLYPVLSSCFEALHS